MLTPPVMFNQQHKNQAQPIPNMQHQNYTQKPPVRGGRNKGCGQRFQRGQTQGPRHNQNLNYAPNVQKYVQQQQYQNQVKCLANWNYCSTHGYDVDDFHKSETCQNSGPRHNFNATGDNPMGRSNKNRNKIFFSNATRKPDK